MIDPQEANWRAGAKLWHQLNQDRSTFQALPKHMPSLPDDVEPGSRQHCVGCGQTVPASSLTYYATRDVFTHLCWPAECSQCGRFIGDCTCKRGEGDDNGKRWKR